MNGTNRKRALRNKGDTRTPYAQMGWEDARNGRPFRYDVGNTMAQSAAYELGRYYVIILRQHGQPVPAWNAAHTVPPKVRTAIDRAMGYAAQELHAGVPYYPVGPSRWQAAA